MKTRNEILATLPSIIRVETEAWGTCYVRQIKGNEFERFMAIMEESQGSDRLARLAVLGLCNADGDRILADGDEAVLTDGPMEPMGEVAAEFLALNGVSEEQKKSSNLPSISPSSSPSSLVSPIHEQHSSPFPSAS